MLSFPTTSALQPSGKPEFAQATFRSGGSDSFSRVDNLTFAIAKSVPNTVAPAPFPVPYTAVFYYEKD